MHLPLLLPLLLLLTIFCLTCQSCESPTTANCSCVTSDSNFLTEADFLALATTSAPAVVSRHFVNASLASVVSSVAFTGSTVGFSVDLNSSVVSLPEAADGETSQLVIDLLAAQGGNNCRQGFNVTQICIDTNCSDCNLKAVTADVRLNFHDHSTQKILYPGTKVPVCTEEGLMTSRAGKFRYIFVHPTARSQTFNSTEFKFRLTLSGEFDSFECEENAKDAACWCKFGQRPKWSDSAERTASIRWLHPHLHGNLTTPSSAYRRLMSAVRLSNLTLTVAEFFNVSVVDSRVSGLLLVRDGDACDDAFLTKAFADLLAGDGGPAVTELTIDSEASTTASTSTATSMSTTTTTTATSTSTSTTAATSTSTSTTAASTAMTSSTPNSTEKIQIQDSGGGGVSEIGVGLIVSVVVVATLVVVAAVALVTARRAAKSLGVDNDARGPLWRRVFSSRMPQFARLGVESNSMTTLNHQH